MNLPLMIAETAMDANGLSGWFSTVFDIAQKLGIGATVVMGVGYYLLRQEKIQQAKDWKELLVLKDAQLEKEVNYSKDRDKQTLTLLGELTNVIKTIDKRDTDEVGLAQVSRQELLTAVKEVGNSVSGIRGLILEHVVNKPQNSQIHAA